MQNSNSFSAKVIIIGNEILSGRTKDKNINFIAKSLYKHGIDLSEVRIIPDIEEDIIKTVLELKNNCNFLFTTGGIGPTHDDITAESISKALNLPYELNLEALKIMEDFYKNKNEIVTNSRKKMAFMPKGSKLIFNPVTVVPGFNIDNIYAMAGIPAIMQGMLNGILKEIKTSVKFYCKTLKILIPESRFALDLQNLQQKYPQIIMGSYPFKKNNIWGADLSLRSTNKVILKKSFTELKKMIEKYDN